MKARALNVVLILSVLFITANKSYAWPPSNQDPVAILTAEPETVFPDANVTLNGSASYDPDGSIVECKWDWTNDGTYDYTESPGDKKATHDYNEPGTYTAKLRVKDNRGATDTDTCTIYVIETYYVSTDGNDDANGLSWPTAFATIQHALDVTSDYNIIEVNEGTYYETIDFNGVSCTLTSTDANDWDVTAATIIDGNDPNANVVTLQNSENSNCQLKGFTITGGARGVYCDGVSPIISNCVITDNNAGAADGGGIYDSNSSLTITNCFIVENDANYGGGIYDFNSLPTLTNCVLSDNTASTDGGGMYNEDSGSTLINCTLSKNDANDYGGGIYNYDSAAILTNCIVWGNTASDGNSIYYNDINHPSDQNFVSWWKFDETSGTTAEDSVGDNNGTVTGAIWTNGQIDGALDFDGVSAYVNVADDDSLDVTNTFTFSLWAYYRGTGSSVLSKDGSTDTTGAYNLYVSSRVKYETNNKFPTVYTPTGSISLNKWYHVAVTFDNSASPKMRIYIDGVERTSGSPPAPSSLSTDLLIGKRGKASSPYWFNGLIDDVRIYGRVLNADEVRGLAICARYSDIQGCGGSDDWNPNFGNDGGGNIDADPCFVDPTTPEGSDGIFGTWDDGLRFGSSSPCIDAADGKAAPETDILGLPRLDNSDVNNTGTGDPNYADIGAYELVSEAFSVLDDSDANMAIFDNLGNLFLKGTMDQNSTHTATDANEFIVENSAGSELAIIDANDGNMYIDGQIFENQDTFPLDGTNHFIIEDSSGNTVAYIDDPNGDLYLKGKLYEQVF